MYGYQDCSQEDDCHEEGRGQGHQQEVLRLQEVSEKRSDPG